MGSYYFAKKNFCTATKNNLEKAIYEYMSTLDRTVIKKSEVQKFKDMVEAKIRDLQAQHPRCKSVRVDRVWSQWYDKSEINFDAYDGMNFVLYQSIN